MLTRIATLTVLSVGIALAADRPAGLSVYTWTREDLFSGPLGNDAERHQRGMQKLEEILKQNPKDADALAMKGFGFAWLATKALERGDRAGFDRQWDDAVKLLDQAMAIDPKGGGVNAVYGATMLYWFDQIPPERREHARKQGKASYTVLYTSQEKGLDQMPVHFKGEVLAGMAEAERRMGNTEQSQVYLRRIVETMAGSPYERRAKQWLEKPETITAASRLMCQSCHDPGRLEARLAAMKK